LLFGIAVHVQVHRWAVTHGHPPLSAASATQWAA
jgi:hypothetical protein